MIVGLDPGHGGNNTGANRGGIVERDWNMAFCHMLHVRLGGTVLLRNYDGESVGLLERGQRSFDAGCAMVLSVHVNASRNAAWHGLLAFYLPDDPIARELSNTMMRSAPKPLYKPGWQAIPATDHSGTKDDWLERPRAVLSPHTCPTVLLEMGYCSNARDAKALVDEHVQEGLVSMVQLMLARFAYMRKQ